MRVDFYLLSQGSVESALPQIARRVKQAGQRMLVVSADPDQRAALDQALWAQFPEDFLAHGMADAPHAARQPLLLGEDCTAANGARNVALADGVWRDEALGFDRAFLFFDAATLPAARACWRKLGDHGEVERRFWKQDGARWVEGP